MIVSPLRCVPKRVAPMAKPNSKGLLNRGSFLSPGSGWRTLDSIDMMEMMDSDFGKPVVHHIPAQSWEIQKRLHVRQRVNGYGQHIAELLNSIRYLLSPQPPRRKEIER